MIWFNITYKSSVNQYAIRITHYALRFTLYALLWLSLPTSAQAVDTATDFEVQNEDDIGQLESDGLITEETTLVLLEMLENPIDLNRADVEDLIAIPGISQSDAQAILAQRQKQNGFVRWDDLSRIEPLSAGQRRTLRAFTEIRPRVNRSDGQVRVDASETDKDGKPYSSRLRIRSDFNNRFFLGFAAAHEDDTQYQWSDESPERISPGWQFDKLYLAWFPSGLSKAKSRATGMWKQVVIGNFTAGFASGLTFNDAHRFSPRGIYTDDTTSSYRQRGVAAAWRVERWSGTAFASDSDYPVTLPAAVTGLKSQRRIDGVYHERLIGSEASFKVRKETQIGAVGYQSWIDKQIDTEFRNLPNRSTWSAAGLYARTKIEQLDVRGEISHSFNAGWASYLEAEFRAKSASLLASLRRYGTDFDNPHSHGFADADDTPQRDVDGDIDEMGLFLQIRYRPHRRVRLRAYYDQWQHPSSLQTDNEAYAEVAVQPSHRLELGTSGKWNDEEITVVGDERRSGLFWLKFQAHPAIRLTSVYWTSRHRLTNRVTPDDYIYFKVEWLLTKQIEWEMRWKVNDTIFIDGDDFPKELYVQLQLWDWQNMSGRVRYTQSRFGSSSTAQPNPNHRIYVRLEYKW